MTLNDLKVFSLFYVNDHENLTKDNKLYFVNFIKEADEFELMNLLVTGKAKKINEDEAIYALESFFNSPVPYLLEAGPGDLARKGLELYGKAVWKAGQKLAGGPTFSIGPIDVWNADKLDTAAKYANALGAGGLALAAGAVVAAISYLGYKVYKNTFSQAAKKCKGTKGPEKKACMNQAKLVAFQANLKALESKMVMCAKSKDPDVCKAKLLKKISKAKSKLQKAKSQK